jgi:hypothetical protein
MKYPRNKYDDQFPCDNQPPFYNHSVGSSTYLYTLFNFLETCFWSFVVAFQQSSPNVLN